MKEYHKIVTAWERDPSTNFKTLLEGRWAEPEFEYLKNNTWDWTEKIDGTNIRVMWDNEKVSFRGKTDSAQLYVPLFDHLQSLFYAGALARIFDGPACLYGEGFGPKIQAGGGNYGASVDFCLFDVLVDETWLQRADVVDIATKLECQVAPILNSGPLEAAIAVAREGFVSAFGAFKAEGFVMRPKTELRTRRGARVITKIKHKDFRA